MDRSNVLERVSREAFQRTLHRTLKNPDASLTATLCQNPNVESPIAPVPRCLSCRPSAWRSASASTPGSLRARHRRRKSTRVFYSSLGGGEDDDDAGGGAPVGGGGERGLGAHGGGDASRDLRRERRLERRIARAREKKERNPLCLK